jgi:hypothetical protein
MKKALSILLGTALLAVAAPAWAQGGQYRVQQMDFDLWCTEQEHIPYERCDQRLPDDVQKFEAYRALIEKFEIRHLQDIDRKLHFDRTIMHYDPIDHSPQVDPQIEPPTDGKSP